MYFINIALEYTSASITLYSTKTFYMFSGAHNLNVRSYELVAINLWSGEVSTDITLPSWPGSVLSGCQVLFDHIFAVPSYDAVTRYCPSILWYFTSDNKFVWQGIVYMQDLFRKSHILQVLSSLAVAMWKPLGEKSIPKRDFKWPSINIMHRPVRRSQTLPKESWPPVALTLPSHWKL